MGFYSTFDLTHFYPRYVTQVVDLARYLGTICGAMNRSPSKLLSILLILLLGLSPLQSVLAATHMPVDQDKMPCHMATESPQLTINSAPFEQDCADCETVHRCNDSCCSYGHCAANGLALLPGFLAFSGYVVMMGSSWLTAEIQTLQTPALFRPPRS